MQQQITGQIIVGEKIEFDYDKLDHSIQRVLNLILVSTIPCIIKVDTLVKMLFQHEKKYFIQVQVKDTSLMVIHESQVYEVENVREEHMIRGIDIGLNLRFLAEKPGNYYIILLVEGTELVKYPLYVRQETESAHVVM